MWTMLRRHSLGHELLEGGQPAGIAQRDERYDLRVARVLPNADHRCLPYRRMLQDQALQLERGDQLSSDGECVYLAVEELDFTSLVEAGEIPPCDANRRRAGER